MNDTAKNLRIDRVVSIRSGNVKLDGEVKTPEGATGLVLFAHGSGSSRHSPRNQFVAQVIREAGVGTLLFDLLTNEEAYARLNCEKRLEIIPGATHLFEEPGTSNRWRHSPRNGSSKKCDRRHWCKDRRNIYPCH